jgi:carboxyl-terminal processing protease
MKKKLNRVIIFGLVLLAFVVVVAGKKLFFSHSDTKKEYQYLSLFSEVTSLVRTDYVESIDPAGKFPGAYRSMLASLDKLSAYLDSHKTRLYPLYLSGKVFSTGVYGTISAGYFLVTDVIPNSPAHASGIKAGDLIKAVNGSSIYGISLWEMILSLVTEKPETLELAVLKKNASNPIKVQLNTKTIQEISLPLTKKIRPDILQINLHRIDNQNVVQLIKYLEEFASTNKKEPMKLIVDLRKYDGGNLEALTKLTARLFPSTMELKLKRKLGEQIITVGSLQPFKYKAVIIVNSSTLFYGEMLAAMFKSARLAMDTKKQSHSITVIGIKTSGFVSLLKHWPLTDGSSIVISEGLFSLDNKNLADAGVIPNIEIKPKDFNNIIDRCISILDTPFKPQTQLDNHEKNQEKK